MKSNVQALQPTNKYYSCSSLLQERSSSAV
jgi:hypothetical protein